MVGASKLDQYNRNHLSSRHQSTQSTGKRILNDLFFIFEQVLSYHLIGHVTYSSHDQIEWLNALPSLKPISSLPPAFHYQANQTTGHLVSSSVKYLPVPVPSGWTMTNLSYHSAITHGIIYIWAVDNFFWFRLLC